MCQFYLFYAILDASLRILHGQLEFVRRCWLLLALVSINNSYDEMRPGLTKTRLC